MGFKLEAFLAGIYPKIMPMAVEQTNAKTIDDAIEQTLSEFDFFEPIGLCFKYILIFLVGIC